MIQRGRPKSELILTPGERGALVMLSRKRKNPVRARRARIVLRCARGETFRLVARAEKVSMRTVAKWRQRFVELRLRGLADAPRAGAPRKISDAAIGRVVRLTVAGRENASDPVSIRSLAHTCGMSRDAVHRIWRSLGLETHAVRASDPAEALPAGAFAGELWDVAGLLLHRAGHALALAGDENEWTHWHTLSPDVAPSADGATRRPDGSTTSREELALLTALARVEEAGEPGALESADHVLARWFDRLETVLPAGVRVRLVLHGFAGGRHLEARRQIRHRQRFEIWFIPSHLGWLARVSGWLACSRGNAFELLRELAAFGENPPSELKPFLWIASPEALVASLSRRAPAEPQPALA